MPASRLTAAVATSLALPLMATAGPQALMNVDVANLWGTNLGFVAEAGVAYRIEASGLIDAAGSGGGYVVNADGVLQSDAGGAVAEHFKAYVAPHSRPRAGETRELVDGLAYGALIAAWDFAPDQVFQIGQQALVSTSHGGARLLLSVAMGAPWAATGQYRVAVTPVGIADVGEPGSLALAALGLAAVGTRRRRPAQR